MPVNPEDEDGVVPDMHAAFGIARAMDMNAKGAAGGTGERSGRGVLGSQSMANGRGDGWRDLGLDEVVRGIGGLDVNGATRGVIESNGISGGQGTRVGVRREGVRGGLLNMR